MTKIGAAVQVFLVLDGVCGSRERRVVQEICFGMLMLC
jgi:hypothetical protein